MSWQIFFASLALVLVLEGLLPFLSPQFWRRSIYQMLAQSDTVLRIIGLSSMVLGALLLFIVRHF